MRAETGDNESAILLNQACVYLTYMNTHTHSNYLTQSCEVNKWLFERRTVAVAMHRQSVTMEMELLSDPG